MHDIQRLFKFCLTLLLFGSFFYPSIAINAEEESQKEETSTSLNESKQDEETEEEESQLEEESTSEEASVDEEKEEEVSELPQVDSHSAIPPLLDTPYLAFAQNRFPSEADADAFIDLIAKDPASKDQFLIKKTQEELNRYVVTIEYKETAKEEGPYILYYVSSETSTEGQAVRFAEQAELLMPDIIFDYAVMSVNESMHDIILGLRPGVETQALQYDKRQHRLTYEGERKAYTYEVLPNAEGLYEDLIQDAITTLTPGIYQFEEFQLPDGQLQVTMTPVHGQVGRTRVEEDEPVDSPQVSLLPIDEETDKEPIQGEVYKGPSPSSYMLGIILFLSAILVSLMIWTSKQK